MFKLLLFLLLPIGALANDYHVHEVGGQVYGTKANCEGDKPLFSDCIKIPDDYNPDVYAILGGTLVIDSAKKTIDDQKKQDKEDKDAEIAICGDVLFSLLTKEQKDVCWKQLFGR